jgi:hypothetical protein
VSRFTIHLLNCYSFGANVAVAYLWYRLSCFCGQILHPPSVTVELHEMEMQTPVEDAIVTIFFTSTDKERGEKPATHVAYYKNFIP